MLNRKTFAGRWDGKEAAMLAGFLVVIWLLWDAWAIFPFKILVVFFHELSHAVAALASGGHVQRVEIDLRQGGVCWTAGGNRFLILSAGYLGSLAWGGLLLVVSARTRHDQAVAFGLGIVLLLTGLVWVRPLLGFGFPATILAGALLCAAAVRLPAQTSDILLKAIGLTSVFYAALDIRDDILRRPHLQESDAARLAELTGLPTLFWGLLWFAVAVAAGALFLAAACRKRPDGDLPRRLGDAGN